MRAEGADLHLDVAAVDGSYAGQEARRGYGLRMLAARAPAAVLANGRALPALQSAAVLEAAPRAGISMPPTAAAPCT
jgi:alpha-glucosidase